MENFSKYTINSDGTIHGVKGILKTYNNGIGYHFVRLYPDDGTKPKNLYVHRLVAEAFIPNPEGKAEVNHINGDKGDNRVENLEWVSPSENKHHAIQTGLHIPNGGPKGHKHTKARSKYHNVIWRPSKGKWYAEVTLHQKRYSRAANSEEDAALKVNQLYLELGITDRPFNKIKD